MNETTIPFWGTSPMILVSPQHINEIFPNKKMTLNQKYNSITRLIIIITLLGFFFTLNLSYIGISLITLLGIYLYYYQTIPEDLPVNANGSTKEGFTEPSEIVKDMLAENGVSELPPKGIFDEITPNNPFSNVLISDYDFNPNKKPAEPSFNRDIIEKINEATKDAIQELNPTIKNLENKLYRGLGDKLTFEQSQQRFVSNPATTIPNNDKAFKDFCYGGMTSCKEGNPFACARNLSRYQN